MKVTFAQVADFAAIYEGKMTIVGIFAQIRAKAVPVRHAHMALAYMLEIGYAEVGRKHKVDVELVDEDGNKLFKVEGEVFAQPTPGHTPKPGELIRLPQVFNLTSAEFKRLGRYDINFFLAGTLAHTLTFEVVKVSEAKAA